MIYDGTEARRLNLIPAKQRNIIYHLNDDADSLWCTGDDNARCKANRLYIIADKIYKHEVLFRTFK